MEHQPIACSDIRSRPAFGHLAVDSLCVNIEGRAVLTDVSIDVARGEIVGLLGRDGAGKTICFQVIAGLTPVTSGKIYLNGLDVSRWPIERRARVGLTYLAEEMSIFRGLTVEENILLALETSEPSPALRPARLETLLADFELVVVRQQLATTISGGERRRCEVARAVALNPTVLLMDEPFKGLDPTSVASTKRTIAGLKRHGVGVLVSDYDLYDLLELLDRVYVLHQGRLIFDGTPHQLLSNELVQELYLGRSFSF